MKLTTSVTVPSNRIFSHKSRYMLLGSCFAEHIGENLSKYRFVGINNPFGILFNPMSIAEGLECIINEKYLTPSDLFYHNGLWHSDLYHGSYSDTEPKSMLHKLNTELSKAYEWLPKVDFLILTFGSSWVYEREGRVVANCHKLPENQFVRRRLTVDDIVKKYQELFANIFRIAPKVKIIISVSPVRYFRDGAFDNSVNKATLLLAVEQLTKMFEQLIYFPAYEILLDELRDYRFYADDMIHPSKLTQSIVWQRFSEAFFTESTLESLSKIERLHKMLNHSFLHENTNETSRFLAKIDEAKNEINNYLQNNGLTLF